MKFSIPFDKQASIALALVLTFVCFLFQSLVWNIGVLDPKLFYTEDSGTYLAVSVHLLPDKFRTIGYPWLIHCIRWLYPQAEPISLLMTQFAFTLTVYVIVLFVLFSQVPKKVSLPLAFLFLINPSLLLFSHAVLTECLFCFLLTIAFYFYLRYFNRKKALYFLYSFSFICLATLVRPGLYYFCVGIFLVLLMYFTLKKNLLLALTLITIFTASIGYQVFKFYKAYQIPKLTMIDDVTLWHYVGAKMCALETNSETLTEMNVRAKEADSVIHGVPAYEQSKYYRQKMNDYIKRKPLLFIHAYAHNLMSNFHTGNLFYEYLTGSKSRSFFHFTRIFNMLNIGFLFVITLVAGIKGIIKKSPRMIMLIIPLLLCNYLFLTAGISYWQGDRFNVVWFPVLYMCIGLFFETKNLRKKLVCLSEKE